MSMRFRRTGALGAHANAAVNEFAARVDGGTTEVAARAAQLITVAVRLLRIPTALIGLGSIPFIVAALVIAILSGGVAGVMLGLLGLVMAGANVVFWIRRRNLLKAVDDPDQLATELAIMLTMTGKVDEARGALTRIAGGGGWRVLERLRGLWQGAQIPGRWIDQIDDLPRARYFGPPRLGTTISMAVTALWLVPISVVVALFAVIGYLAGSL
ncbi:hypothetical protein [Aeromicrobium wangtongii]|uniref:hypothetical protein n=1 Tax=Aeromicrobium wangtongii TaxID=2969247 RepID=UPI002017331A|nr:hypothetical protein [Aeromicrobium wangtongii]MCL3817449.1 hypothetical protein [Aeromicrobium wangtongii]